MARADLKEPRKYLNLAEKTAKEHELELKAIKDSLRTTREELESEKMSIKRHLEDANTLMKESSENLEGSTQTDEQNLEAEKDAKTKEAKEKQAKLKTIDCKFYTANGCRRGIKCWFRHKNEGINKSDCKFKEKCRSNHDPNQIKILTMESQDMNHKTVADSKIENMVLIQIVVNQVLQQLEACGRLKN